MSNERRVRQIESSGVSPSIRGRMDAFVARTSHVVILGASCLGAWGLAGCQAPDGPSPFGYGSAPLCAELDENHDPVSLQAGLTPLREAFDGSIDVPRMIVLMPHMGCERGAEILRDHVLDAYPEDELALFVVWQDEARAGGAAAAARASTYLRDPRVKTFHDCSGIAGRAFARGNLPIAEAREVFLFYPAGLGWPTDGSRPTSARPVARDQAPRTDSWVHQLGRVVPERFCTPEELPEAIGETIRKLIEDAEKRREDLGTERRMAAAG